MIDWSNISLQDFAGFLSEQLRKKGSIHFLIDYSKLKKWSKKEKQEKKFEIFLSLLQQKSG